MKGGSRLPVVVMVGLIAVLVIGGFAFGGKSSSKKKPSAAAKPAPPKKQPAEIGPLAGFAPAAKGGRAATVETAGSGRTVVVPPCDTPVQATVANAIRGAGTPGATVLQLPRARVARTVIVPACTGKSGQTQLPSAALVLPSAEQPPGGVKAQLSVARSVHAQTIVLPPCAPAGKGAGTGKTAAAPPSTDLTRAASGRVVVAPAC